MNARAAGFTALPLAQRTPRRFPGPRREERGLSNKVALPRSDGCITLDLPRSKTGKPASSTICRRPCTAKATRCYSRGDVVHEPTPQRSDWVPLSRTRQCERQPPGGPKSLVWVTGGKTLSEYMSSGLLRIADTA